MAAFIPVPTSRELGCSRTLIWQAVHAIEQEFGLTVFSVRGQGYKLAEPFEWLDVASVRDALSSPAAETFTLAVTERTDSTNSQLMARAASGGLHGLVLAAEMQSAGRGRLGRRWQTRLGAGLTFSCCGVLIAAWPNWPACRWRWGWRWRALHRLAVPVQLKWPNDVLLNGRKLAGILIELSGDALGPAAVVIGIGLNLDSPGEVDQPVASLAEAGIRLGRNQLLAALLSELAVVLDTFNREGFAAFRDDWMRCSSHENAPVRLSFSHAEPVDGIARGVAENGALQVETADGAAYFSCW
jgi:BirA family biotin operon repressor/biotin-[acetyl-CoA-carboxylase] ligase